MLQLSALRREFRARRLLKAQIVSAGGGQRQCVREGGGRGAARACPTDGHTLVCRLQRQSFSGRLVACPGLLTYVTYGAMVYDRRPAKPKSMHIGNSL